MTYSIEFPAFFIISLYYPPTIPLENLFFYFKFMLINYCSGLLFSRLIPAYTISIVFWVLTITLSFPSMDHIVPALIFIIVLFATKYMHESKLRMISILKQAASKDVEKTEELLSQMLPQHVLINLEEENSVTDRLSNVTLMYADIVGFTAWSSTKTPIEVVNMLSLLFTKFDKLCLIHNVYKVHTIGDCYVIFGYITDKKRNPSKEAVNVINFALAMLDIIEENNKDYNLSLKMRIGIHTGEVIGGITGTNIVRYDIYGSDTLIANKMESNGMPGHIAVSEVTKSFLEDYQPDKFVFKEFKEISIPVLGINVKMFLIDKFSMDMNAHDLVF